MGQSKKQYRIIADLAAGMTQTEEDKKQYPDILRQMNLAQKVGWIDWYLYCCDPGVREGDFEDLIWKELRTTLLKKEV